MTAGIQETIFSPQPPARPLLRSSDWLGGNPRLPSLATSSSSLVQPDDFTRQLSRAARARLAPLQAADFGHMDPESTRFTAKEGAQAPQEGADRHDRLVRVTRQWVAQAFFGTLLKQMRESPFRSELFSGGRAGQAFGSMLDQHLSERMGRGAGGDLVNAIVRRIEASSAYRKQGSDVKPAA